MQKNAKVFENRNLLYQGIRLSKVCIILHLLLKGTCTFEKDKCGFKDDTSGQFMWTKHRGRTSSSGTGPSTDHTLQTSLGKLFFSLD